MLQVRACVSAHRHLAHFCPSSAIRGQGCSYLFGATVLFQLNEQYNSRLSTMKHNELLYLAYILNIAANITVHFC